MQLRLVEATGPSGHGFKTMPCPLRYNRLFGVAKTGDESAPGVYDPGEVRVWKQKAPP
jgi:hypothetical protein